MVRREINTCKKKKMTKQVLTHQGSHLSKKYKHTQDGAMYIYVLELHSLIPFWVS